ncbi:hypothetical protein J2S40_000572 [Nocardioides luteus]|uniref:Altered inheritance of mitochondria protein 6 n=1 Tax=Nocardioides luteus TaxID=1844 RepID=A0ABQ5SWS6_9ACTN|nr:hypothetical protein [Nocardioides luteus]MDR7309514.1 hypothetical protein [Nocardioides luteus]GGR51750.1 hypothetical protein GCM10010197_17350 [Nocardioides luteus]GLJ67919.1 hypothetical protein GCM10017579_19550 [Nocardioides luteus]
MRLWISRLSSLLTMPFTMLVGLLRTAPARAAGSGLVDILGPLAHAHSHNDYEHERPLHDALGHRYTSVEADVWLVDGDLYLGHFEPDMTRTLRNVYLDPLADLVTTNDGSVHPSWDGTFQLLVDVKSGGVETWRVLEEQLAAYDPVFSVCRDGVVEVNPVTVIVSGERDRLVMAAEPVRRSFYDATFEDLEAHAVAALPVGLVGMVSANWIDHFTWRGIGPFLSRRRLHEMVDRAHDAGWPIRLWGAPAFVRHNRRRIWQAQLDAGVDWINTDHLDELAHFLARHRPTRLGLRRGILRRLRGDSSSSR